MIYSLKKTLLFSLVILLLAGIIIATEVIQTQESDLWEGIEVDLLSIKIKNNVLTVKFKIRNESTEYQSGSIWFESCYIMDETNQKKYFPLKDADGKYIASGGNRTEFRIQPGKSQGMWIKFPEPTDNPETITISLTGIFPFEDVELKK